MLKIEYSTKTHYYSSETRQALLRRLMADKNRIFPTEVDRNFVCLGQILISLQLRLYKRFFNMAETLP